MALKLEWTHEAEIQLDAIIQYLEQNWTEKEIRNFFSKLESGLKSIQKTPELHKQSLRKPIAREYQITPHTTLFYVFDETTVTVLLLWPNRMSPELL